MLVKTVATTLAATLGMLALFLAATIAVITAPLTAGPLSAAPTPDTAGAACVPAGHGPTAGFRSDQLANAATIVAVGNQLHVPAQGWLVALTAALTESGLRNLRYGDRDSLGLFQQRPSQGWGTPAQILNPAYSATQFYRHLVALPGWQQMSVNNAAQAVQRSATPTAYAPHEPAARTLLHTLTDIHHHDTGHTAQPDPPPGSGPLACTPPTPPPSPLRPGRTPHPPERIQPGDQLLPVRNRIRTDP